MIPSALPVHPAEPALTPPTTAPNRRALLRGAAWSVPVISLASVAPAFAASEIALTPGVLIPVPEAVRCTPVTDLSFAATVGGSPAPDGSEITITLPAGLTFVGGSSSQVVRTSGGVAMIPSFTANGSAGTYSIQASFRGSQATQTLVVTPQPGQVFEIHRTSGNRNTAATFSSTPVSVTDAVGGAILGDQTTMNSNTGPATTAGANAAVLTATGSVRYWGRDFGVATTAPATLAYNGVALSGMEHIDVWSSIGANNASTGGVAAGTNPASVHQWYRSGTGALVVVRVTGITGDVLEVASEDGRSYVHTTTGLFTWPTATAGTGAATVAATHLIQSSGLVEFSTYGHLGSSNLKWGGAAVAANTLHVWTNSTTVTQVSLPTGVTSARKVITSDAGLMLLSDEGQLWTRGTATGDATTWTLRATDIADFSMWGFNDRYIGGLYVGTNGQATRFFGSNTWQPTEVMRIGDRDTGAILSGVTKTYSSDGTYLLLTADGTVYASGGNYDNSGRTGANVINTGAGVTMDLNVWGHHLSSVYYGGGYVIKGGATC